MKKYISLGLFLFLISISNFSYAQDCYSTRYKNSSFRGTSTFEDVVYSKAVPYSRVNSMAKKEYTFDFYEPEGDELEERPLVLMMAGGSFQTNNADISDAKTWCDSLARYGYACATIEYRSGYNPKKPESVERAIYRSVQDLRAAIRYFEEYYLTFKIDPDKIYIGGDEAGAIAALHAAYMTDEEKRPRSSYGISGESYDLGCLDCSGNDYRHDVEIAGVINLRGELSLELLENIKKKIPTVHVAEEMEESGYSSTNEEALSFLKMQGSEKLHRRMEDLDIDNQLVNPPIVFKMGVGTSASTSASIWNAVWSNINGFLYSTLEFKTAQPFGNTLACSGKAEKYNLPLREGSSYCWEIDGGRLIKNNGNEIEVIWNYNTKVGKITVIERDAMEVVGNPSDVLEVEIRTAPQAEFSVNKIKDHICLLTDESAFGTFYTIDFGDGTNPYNGKPGTTTNHTYTTMGEYTITQVLENSCGVAVSTQQIEISEVPLKMGAPTIDEKVVLYPNPAKIADEISINFLEEEMKKASTIHVAKSSGELLFVQKAEAAVSSAVMLKANTLKAGKYTVEVHLEDGTVIKKELVVE